MHDWRAFVREHLAGRALSDQAVEELAQHVEQVYRVARSSGRSDADAIAAVMPSGVELDYHDGGQPAWWWLLCAE